MLFLINVIPTQMDDIFFLLLICILCVYTYDVCESYIHILLLIYRIYLHLISHSGVPMDLVRNPAVSQSKQDVELAAIQRRNLAVVSASAVIAMRFTVKICRLARKRKSTCKLMANGGLGETGVNAQRHAVEDTDCECVNVTIQHLCKSSLHSKA